MRIQGVVQAVNYRRRLAAIELPDARHVVIQWVGLATPLNGDHLAGYFESFGAEDVHNLTQGNLIEANVRFLGCSRDVALAIMGLEPA
jgi:hypothetical protein